MNLNFFPVYSLVSKIKLFSHLKKNQICLLVEDWQNQSFSDFEKWAETVIQVTGNLVVPKTTSIVHWDEGKQPLVQDHSP